MELFKRIFNNNSVQKNIEEEGMEDFHDNEVWVANDGNLEKLEVKDDTEGDGYG